jgi:hypothetical protein
MGDETLYNKCSVSANIYVPSEGNKNDHCGQQQFFMYSTLFLESFLVDVCGFLDLHSNRKSLAPLPPLIGCRSICKSTRWQRTVPLSFFTIDKSRNEVYNLIQTIPLEKFLQINYMTT